MMKLEKWMRRRGSRALNGLGYGVIQCTKRWYRLLAKSAATASLETKFNGNCPKYFQFL